MGTEETGRMKDKKEKSVKKRSRTAAGILAILAGSVGAHKFYLGEWKKGVAYLLFFWSGVPLLLGIVEGAGLLGSDAADS